MDWLQLAAIIIPNVALFIWARTEANQDRREFQSQLYAALKSISDEMKDFHGRLCKIEERGKK